MDNLQTAQKALSSLQTLLSEVSENLRSGQQQLSSDLQSLQKDLSVAKETVQSVAQQVSILESLQQTTEKIERSVNELMKVLLGRRSGQAGEQIVSKLLSAIPLSQLTQSDIALPEVEEQLTFEAPDQTLEA
ncbi:MAG: hypothetical protein RMK94_16425, partial [Armatimonadota bacterium]|nr:hypothetical protein [Armatimonadota bacterium]